MNFLLLETVTLLTQLRGSPLFDPSCPFPPLFLHAPVGNLERVTHPD